MTKLDRAWMSWRDLGQTDRAHFLTLLKEAYRQMRAERIGVAPRSIFDEMRLTDADLDAAEDRRAWG